MIVNINGYEIETAEKHVAAQGFWYVATKGSKKYFLKQYNPAKPLPPSSSGGSEKVYAKNLRMFEQRVAYRTKVNQKIRSFTSTGGNIVIPSEEFVCQLPDESGKNLCFYWEATELIPNVIPDEELEDRIKGLDDKQKQLVMATAAGALGTIHQRGIVHSDLKLGNVLLATNSSGKIVTKLIDFDGSYFMDDKDTLIAGDEVYCSPELLLFYSEEDDDTELRARLNEKSDIFSLGLIYHFYLSGELPVGVELPEYLQRQKDRGRPIHCSEVLLGGGKLQLSSKIRSLKHILLIRDMLQQDPEKRPSAQEVLMRLREPEIEFSVDDPWPGHNIVLKTDKIRGANCVILRKVKVDGDEKYEMILKNGNTSVVTKDELVSDGLAEAAVTDTFDEPWPEHNITFDIEYIKSKKYVALERATLGSTKGYNLYRANRSHQFIPLSNLLMLGFAHEKGSAPKPPVGGSGGTEKPVKPGKPEKPGKNGGSGSTEGGCAICDPWPGHNIVFNKEAMLARKYVRVERAEMNGKKGYYFYSASSSKRFILLETLVVLGLADQT